MSIEEEVFASPSVSEVVRRTVEGVLAAAGAKGGELPLLIIEAVKGAVEGGAEVAADASETARGIMIGVLGVAQGADAEDAIVLVTKTLRDEVSKYGWDLAGATRGLVLGAVEAAPAAGIQAERVIELVHESMRNG